MQIGWKVKLSIRGFRIGVPTLGVASLLLTGPVMSHHAAAVYFDTSATIEVRGIITGIKWQNPHIGFTLTARESDGDEISWLIESNSVSNLRQLGITADQLISGEIVTVAGWPARQTENRMSGNHLLFADGRELVLRGSGAKYFSTGTDERLTVADYDARDVGDATSPGLFRVWSTVTGDPDQDRLWAQSYPLTDAAITAQDAWDPLRDNPAINCEPKGMPSIIDPPYPMEISDQGNVIVIRQEEFDTVRTIYMDPSNTPANPGPSLLGHSVGHWDGNTLVVETTNISWPYFDGRGVPQSDQMRLVERFTVSANGRRLNYTLEVSDPLTFTEPVHLDRFWLWIPENRVEPYNCRPL